jgi:ATP-dependent DNA ligase
LGPRIWSRKISSVFGALLVGVFEAKKLKFAGRVGIGFSEKLLSTLFSELNKIRIEKNAIFLANPLIRRINVPQVGTA